MTIFGPPRASSMRAQAARRNANGVRCDSGFSELSAASACAPPKHCHKCLFCKRPVGEPTRQASHSLIELCGSGDGDGLTGFFFDRPKSSRVIPLGYTSISGRRRFRRGCSQKAPTSRSRDSRNFRKLTPLYRHVW